MITSSMPGRIRIRHPRLRERAFTEEARGRLASLPGVEVTTSERVGSILVTYDPRRATEQQVRERIELPDLPADMGAAAPGGAFRFPGRRQELGLVACLGVTVAAGFLKMKWLHIASGVILVGMVGAHVYRSGKRGGTAW